MIATWGPAYLAVWVVTSIAAFIAARRMGDRRLSWIQTLVLGVLAGAAWPLLVLGALELTSVAALSKAMSRREARESERASGIPLDEPTGDGETAKRRWPSFK